MFGETAKYHTAIGRDLVIAYPVTVNKDTGAKFPEAVQKVIAEEIDVYVKAADDEGEAKLTMSLYNRREYGVTVKNLAPNTHPWRSSRASTRRLPNSIRRGYPSRQASAG